MVKEVFECFGLVKLFETRTETEESLSPIGRRELLSKNEKE